jgi:hypothetical protein
MRARVWLGLLVSAVLLGLAVRGVHLDEVGQSLRQVRAGWLLAVLASIFVRFWLTAWRWQILLRPTKRVSVHRLFGVTLIGFMANNVLPFRIGELVRAYALGRAEAMAAPLSFATIVVERIFDGFTLLLFLLGGLAFLALPPLLLWLAAASCVLYVVVLAVLLSLRSRRGLTLVETALTRLPARLHGAAHRLVDSFRLGLDTLGDARALAGVAGLSLVIWTVNALGLQAMFPAFALALPWHAGFLVQAIVAGLLILPSAPGYVGTFQFATVLALGLFGVTRDVSLSLSIVYHAVNYVPITVVGLAYLGALNLTLGELRAAGQAS